MLVVPELSLEDCRGCRCLSGHALPEIRPENSLQSPVWGSVVLWKIGFIHSIVFIYFLNVSYSLCYYSCPIYSSPPCTPLPPALPPLSSRPWVVHINPLASPFPILFLTSPYLLCMLPFMLLIPCTFFPHSPHSLSPLVTSMWSPFLWFCSCSHCLVCICFCFIF